MSLYKRTSNDNVIRIDTVNGKTSEWHIPPDPENGDYQQYLVWLAEGNTPDPADPPTVTFGRQIAISERKVQTVGATSAELFRQTLPSNTGYIARLQLIGIADDLSLRAIEAIVVVGRGSGNVIIIQNSAGQNQSITADHRSNATATSWTIVPSVDNTSPNGNQRRDYVITVTGSAGRTVNWRMTGIVDSFTPGGEAS